MEGGDRVLLCSDGLTDMLPEDEINQVLDTEAEPEQACRRLVALRERSGGPGQHHRSGRSFPRRDPTR